jgi:hypothetical protein
MSEWEIAQALAPVVDGELVVPYPGKWARPPYALLGGRAVIAADSGLSSIVVEPVNAAVVLVDSRGESVVNRSLEAFVACARAYTAAINAPIVEGDDDGDDDAWEEVGDRLIAELRGIDPDAAADERFWSVAAEEVGYGMTAPDVDVRPAQGSATASSASAAVVEPAKKRLLLAMSDEQRAETFASGLWRRLTAATRVTVAPALPQLIDALELMARTSSQRGEPMPQPDYLLCADSGGELSAAIEAGLLDRLTGLRLICRLTPTAQSAAGGVTRASGIPVFTFGGENAANQVVSLLASRGGR